MATKITSHTATDGNFEDIWNLFFGFFGFPIWEHGDCVLEKNSMCLAPAFWSRIWPQHIAMIVPLKPEKKPGDFLRGDKGHVGFFGERFKAFPEEPKVCKRDVFGVRMKPDIFFI